MRRPHLATDVDLGKLKFPVLGFPKLDGVRLLYLTDKATGRSLKTFDNLFVTSKFSDRIYAGLDGEATFGSITSNTLCSDTTSVLSTVNGTPDIAWNVFDYINDKTVNLTYLERYDILRHYIKQHKPPNVSIIEYVWLANKEAVVAFYEKCLSEGFEGIVLRDPYGKYKEGRTTLNEGSYLRMKPVSDKDALVIGIIEAQQNLNEAKKDPRGYTERSSCKENKVGKGMVGVLVCVDLETGQTINVGPGKMAHKDRVYFFEHQDKILQRYIKYRSADSGVKNAPRQARFYSFRANEDVS